MRSEVRSPVLPLTKILRVIELTSYPDIHWIKKVITLKHYYSSTHRQSWG